MTKAFNRFINDKLAAGQLDRIVVDECHFVLFFSETRMPKVLELCELAMRGCQTVYLTATLPPKEEPSWLEAMGLKRRIARIMRDSTTRRNIAYQVVKFDKQEEEEKVPEVVHQKLDEHREGQVVILSWGMIDMVIRSVLLIGCVLRATDECRVGRSQKHHHTRRWQDHTHTGGNRPQTVVFYQVIFYRAFITDIQAPP